MTNNTKQIIKISQEKVKGILNLVINQTQRLFVVVVIFSLVFPNPQVFVAQASSSLNNPSELKDVQNVAQDLSWGALAMNTHKSTYAVGEKVNLSMAVLDEKGNMDCSAKLELAINKIDTNEIEVLSTDNKEIRVNPECQIKDYTEKPDFEAEFGFKKVGKYSLTLTARTKNGSRSISSVVSVGVNEPFVIERVAPTRVYPIKDYPVVLQVTAKQNFSGVVQEFLPNNFEVIGEPQNSADAFKNLANVIDNNSEDFNISKPYVGWQEGRKIINYPVNLKAGEQVKLSYAFNAPDVSPEFYQLGKVQFINGKGEKVYTEPRTWEIANDAVSYKSGVFTKKTSTGAQTVSGLGFKPKAIMFSWTAQTTDNAFITSSSTLGFGFSTLTGTATSSRSIAYCSDSLNTGGNSDTAVRQSQIATIMIMGGGGTAAACAATLVGEARITTFDNDGFTLNWTVANNQAYIVRYTAYGGDDITNATTSSFTLTTGTGAQSVTGLGFRPDVLLYMGANTTTAATAFDGNTTQGRFSLGWTTAATSTEQGVIAFTGEHNQTSGDTAMSQRTGTSTILYLAVGNPPAADGYFNTQSLDSDGFTIRKIDAVTANTPVFYMAIKGGQWKGGNDTQKNGTGVQSTTGFGFKPEGVSLMSWGLVAGTANTNSAVISFGSAGWATTSGVSATTSTGAIAFADIDGDTTPDPDVGTWSTSTPTTIVGLTPVAGASPTISSRARVESFDSDGFTLNWTTADTTLRQFLYLAVGSNPNLSGNVYSNEGITGLANSRTIALVITNAAGTASTTYSTSTVASTGKYDFLGVGITASSTLAVYLDGATEDAVTVTKFGSSVSSITDFNLYQNYVILRNEATGSTTNADIDAFDGDNDADVPFTSNSNNIVVNSNTNLYIWSGNAYDPNGTVTTQGTGSLIATTSAVVFLDTTGNVIAGDIVVGSSATVTIGANTTVNGGDISTTGSGIVNYAGTPTLTISGTGSIGGGGATVTFYNLTTSGSGVTTITATTSIASDLTVGTGTTLSGTKNITVAGGDLTGDGTVSLTGGTFEMQGAGYFGGNTAWTFYNLNIGNGTSYSATSTGTGTVTVTSVLSIGSTSVLNAGTKNWILTGTGTPFSVSGTFTASTSLVGFQGVGTSTIPDVDYYNLYLNPASGSSFFNFATSGSLSLATNTYSSEIDSFAIDYANGAIYAGAGSTGFIYKCVLSTGCSSNNDWSVATDTPSLNIYSLAVDATNGSIYAGGYSTGQIYKCVLSTGCVSDGNWTLATDTDSTFIRSLSVDATNGAIYAGAGSTGQIYKCVLSTGCSSTDNWTVATVTAETTFTSMTQDTINGVLYAGTNTNGIIFKCVLSTGCASTGNWVTATDTPSNNASSMAVDVTNGAIYAGDAGGNIHKCVLSTGCASTGNWVTATSIAANTFGSMVVDSLNGVIYVADSSSAGNIYKCILSTGCISTGNWTRAFSGIDLGIMSMVEDSVNGAIYVGTTNSAIIYKLPTRANIIIGNDLNLNGLGSVVLDLNSTNATVNVVGNFTIGSGDSFSAGSATSTFSGNFTNNGTFAHNNGAVVFEPASTSTITSANSMTFNNLSIVSPGKELRFQAHSGSIPVFTINGTFVASGSPNNLIILQSDSSSVQWLVHFNSVQSSVTYVYIKNSGCDSGSASVTLGTEMNDGGNNSGCWFVLAAGASNGGGTGGSESGSGGGSLTSGGGNGGGGGGVDGGGGSGSTGGGGGGGGGTP